MDYLMLKKSCVTIQPITGDFDPYKLGFQAEIFNQR